MVEMQSKRERKREGRKGGNRKEIGEEEEREREREGREGGGRNTILYMYIKILFFFSTGEGNEGVMSSQYSTQRYQAWEYTNKISS